MIHLLSVMLLDFFSTTNGVLRSSHVGAADVACWTLAIVIWPDRIQKVHGAPLSTQLLLTVEFVNCYSIYFWRSPGTYSVTTTIIIAHFFCFDTRIIVSTPSVWEHTAVSIWALVACRQIEIRQEPLLPVIWCLKGFWDIGFRNRLKLSNSDSWFKHKNTCDKGAHRADY